MIDLKKIAALTHKGIKVCYISSNQDSEAIKGGVTNGEYEIVFFTPEMLLLSKRWRELPLGEVYLHRLQAFIIDETRTLIKW